MNLKEKPFHLSDLDIAWVEETLNTMTLEEKIGQLFCPIGFSTDRNYLGGRLLDKHIGGLFFRDGLGEEMRDTFEYVQNKSKIPLLIPSNLETGGNGSSTDGTNYGTQMEVAAANDPMYAYRLGKIACSEGAAVGCNWAFAPVVDIDMAFRNPITNVRTYGSDPEVVLENALQYLKAAKEHNFAVSIKHFPGDGVDERDQHLLTTINSLSIEEWDGTYGKVYQGLIDDGALTVMAGHISMPAYQQFFNRELPKQVIPATLSPELLQGLLREKLKFNGLIVTDATPMAGFTTAMSREKAVPYAIESGCDMFLFNIDLSEDYDFMMKGYQTGILSEKRLNEANRRILATKAALKLHEKQKKGSLVPEAEALKVLQCKEHVTWANELADKAVTLVKDTQGLLPISSEKYKRVLLQILGDFPSNDRVIGTVKEELEQAGFEISLYEREDFSKGVDHVADIKRKYDLVIYIGNVENASNKTTNRINWYTFFGVGNNLPWFVHEVPTLFISVANPYHLFDVPMIKTYINCYANNPYILKAVVQKVLGKSKFKGKSPVDPFCGKEELSY